MDRKRVLRITLIVVLFLVLGALWPALQGEFSMGSSGLGSSTTYWGIQYVPSGERLGFQGSRLEGWISDRDGWRWEESGGDNRCYIQELDERWYYYEMSF